MRISDWSSDVCSSDLEDTRRVRRGAIGIGNDAGGLQEAVVERWKVQIQDADTLTLEAACVGAASITQDIEARSEEHTSELQSLMRISYSVFCLKKKQLYYISLSFYYLFFYYTY